MSPVFPDLLRLFLLFFFLLLRPLDDLDESDELPEDELEDELELDEDLRRFFFFSLATMATMPSLGGRIGGSDSRIGAKSGAGVG